MPYTVNQIKLHAYNFTEQPDYNYAEAMLFREFAYCYECYRCGYRKEDIEPLMADYIEHFEFLKWFEEQQAQKGSDSNGEKV